MPRVRDVLYRFRPAGAPGAASATGVPVDRVAEVAAELAPLFATLSGTERECADIVSRARREADDVHARAVQRAGELVRAAEEQVEGVRAAAMSGARRRGEQESAAALAAAERDAAQVRGRAEQRLQPMVDSLVAQISAAIGEPVTGSTGRSPGEPSVAPA